MTPQSEPTLQAQVEQTIRDAVHGTTDIQTAAELILALVSPAPMSVEWGVRWGRNPAQPRSVEVTSEARARQLADEQPSAFLVTRTVTAWREPAPALVRRALSPAARVSASLEGCTRAGHHDLAVTRVIAAVQPDDADLERGARALAAVDHADDWSGRGDFDEL